MNRKGMNMSRERRSHSILRIKDPKKPVFLRTWTHTTFTSSIGFIHKVLEDVQKKEYAIILYPSVLISWDTKKHT